MKYEEIEFKYDANDIRIASYHETCKRLGKSEYFIQFGSDTFYRTNDLSKFCRHRKGKDINQLTFKEKTSVENSIIRKEVNVDLGELVDTSTVSEFLFNMRYTKENTINKSSFVYVFDTFILAYYICLDTEFKELGRFLEIELREDKDLGTTEEKLQLLTILERKLRSLGLYPKHRIKESLFDMFGFDKSFNV